MRADRETWRRSAALRRHRKAAPEAPPRPCRSREPSPCWPPRRSSRRRPPRGGSGSDVDAPPGSASCAFVRKQCRGQVPNFESATPRIHPRGTAGRHRHHRRARRLAAARGGKRSRGGAGGQPVRTTSISWALAVCSTNRPRGSCPPAAGAPGGSAIRTAVSGRLSRAGGITTFSLTSTSSRCTTWERSAATATTSAPW